LEVGAFMRGAGWAVVVVGALGLTGLGLAAFRVGPAPQVRITSDLPGIGARTRVTIDVEEPTRGLSAIEVVLWQGDERFPLAQRQFVARPAWAFWGPRTAREQLVVEVGAQSQRGLREGEAVLRVSAARAGAWLRAPEPALAELKLPVRLVPPAVEVLSTQHYVAQGGAEVVVYRVGPSSVRDGVQAGERFFPGAPLPGAANAERFALFGVPYDLADVGRVQLVATDDVGNTTRRTFVDRFFAKPLTSDTIQLTDAFLDKVVPEIRAQTPGFRDAGGRLENYLAINRDLRRQNADELVALARDSAPRFLWHEPFLALHNGQVMAAFADRRTYVYGGQQVDQQDHLGFDLASVKRAEVTASNAGAVVLARYFGIYGNAVVVDHGYGLMTLYAHLSSFAVKPGDSVRRGQTLGRTGDTGLAGGDHLHFTVLVAGLPVNPAEWWDGHWIQDRVVRKLGQAFADPGASQVPEPARAGAHGAAPQAK
jgi:murein DD-endopeptidase MepM/ murein hydrolase activator NlpD